MTGDLFSAGFAWGDVAPAATLLATPLLAETVASSDPVSQPVATLVATAFAPDFAWNSDDVASVAGVADGSGSAALSRPLVAVDATPVATPKTADFRQLPADAADAVANVASVASWGAGVERMRANRDRPYLYHADWKTLIQDAAAFVRLWGDDAINAGWSTLDVFGCNPNGGHRRVDRLGLVLLLDGRPIQSLDRDTALIGTGNDTMTFHRTARAKGAVPVWTLPNEEEVLTSAAVAVGGGRGSASSATPTSPLLSTAEEIPGGAGRERPANAARKSMQLEGLET